MGGGRERGRGRRGFAVLCVWELEMMSFIEAQRGATKEKSAGKQEQKTSMEKDSDLLRCFIKPKYPKEKIKRMRKKKRKIDIR